jgi:hypothetical protein
MDSNPEVAHPTRMDNCSPRYESILNKPPHPLTPGLVSHCSAELPKTVLMPSSRRKDGGKPRGLGLIDLVDAPFNELDQLALLCEPTSLGVDEDSEAMTATDQLYRDNDKVGKMNPGSFSPLLVPVQTNLVKILGATTSKATNRVRDRTSSFGSSTSTVCIIPSSLHPFEHQQTLKSLTHPSEGSFSKPRVETQARITCGSFPNAAWRWCPIP